MISKNSAPDFLRNGYIVLPNFFNKREISEFEATISALICQLIPSTCRHSNILSLGESISRRSDRNEILIKLLHKMEVNDNFFTKNIMSKLDKIFQILTSNGGFLFAHLQVKPLLPNDSKWKVPWHTDKIVGCSVNDSRQLTVWVPLVDITPSNGGLYVSPGTHKNDKTYDYYEEQHYVSCSKGDVIILHPLLAHRSSRNKSNESRWAMAYFLYGSKVPPFLTEVKHGRLSSACDTESP